MPTKLNHVERLLCEECNHEARSEWKLKVHIEAFHMNEEQQLKGKKQTEQMKMVWMALKDQKQQNLKMLELKCRSCHFQAKFKKDLKLHDKDMHRVLQYPCPHCKRPSPTVEKLSFHIRTTHEGSTVCIHCRMTASSRESLRKHIKRAHTSKSK